MGRVAKSERTKAQLRAERKGLKRAKKVMSRPAPSGLSAPMPGRKRPALFNPKVRKQVVNRAKRRENADARRELRYDRQVREGKRKGFVLRRDPAKAKSFVPTTSSRGTRRLVAAPKPSTLPRMVDPITPKATKAFRRADDRTIARQAQIIARDAKTVSGRKGSVGRQNEAVQRLRDFGQVSGESRSKLTKAIKAEDERQARLATARERKRIARQGGFKTGDPLKKSGLSTVLGAGKEAAGLGAALVARKPRAFAQGGPIGALAELGAEAGSKKAAKAIGGKIAEERVSKGLRASGIAAPRTVSRRLRAKRPENILRILDQTQRPVFASAGAANEIVRQVKKGKAKPGRVLAEAGRGLTLKDREYYSDVLKTAGVRKAGVAAGLGFALDVLLDPLTYATFGAGAAATTGAKTTARTAARRTLKTVKRAERKKGATRAEAKATARRRAADQYERVLEREAFERDKSGKVKVDDEGNPIPRRGTQFSVGAFGRNARVTLRGKGKPKRDSGSKRVARKTVTLGNPQVEAGAGLKPNTQTASRGTDARLRADRSQGQADAQRWVQFLTKAQRGIPKKYRDLLWDAGEQPAGSAARQEILSQIPEKYLVKSMVKTGPNTRIPFVKAVDDLYKYEKKRRRYAGQTQGEIDAYRPHMLREMVEPGRSRFGRVKKALSSEDIVQEGQRVSRGLFGNSKGSVAGSTRRRNIQGTRVQAKEEFGVELTANDPLAFGNYAMQGIAQRQRNRLRNEIDDWGENIPIVTRFAKPGKKGPSKEERAAGQRYYKKLLDQGVSKKVAEARAQKYVADGQAQRTVNLKGFDPDNTYDRIYVHTTSRPDGAGKFADIREATASELESLRQGIVPPNVTRVTRADSRQFNSAVESFNPYTRVLKKANELRAEGKETKAWAYEQLIAGIYDPIMRGWKGIATRTPTFHIRNMIGDVAMAYNAVPANEVPARTLDALRITWYLRGMRKNPYGFTKRNDGRYARMRFGKKDMTIEQIAQEMADEGVIIGGVLGADLDSLARHGVNGISRINSRARVAVRGVDNTLQDRENLMRMVVYTYARDSGMSRSRAARYTADTMIDYGELSSAEREVWKRVAPFYVFAARSIPIYAVTLAKRPGKIANFEKARQETGAAQNLDADMIRNTAGFRQRGYGFPLRLEEDFGVGPLKLSKGTYLVSNGLPIMALNQLPAFFSKNPAAFQKDLDAFLSENIRYWGSSLAPTIGAPLETIMNRSFFYGRPLQTDYRPHTPAPVGNFLDAMTKLGKERSSLSGVTNNLSTAIGVGKVTSSSTGKKVTGWNPKFENALLKFTAGAPGFVLNLTRDENRRGQNDWQQVISFLSGQKFDPYQKDERKRENAFEVWNELKKEYDSLASLSESDPKVKRQRTYVGRMQREVEDYINSVSDQPVFKRPTSSGGSRKQKFSLGGGSSGFKLGGGSSGFKLGGN